jgi:hypothetical protein
MARITVSLRLPAPVVVARPLALASLEAVLLARKLPQAGAIPVADPLLQRPPAVVGG